MPHYVCHVRVNGGEYETGTDFYQGDVPRAGKIVQIVVYGETRKGRVGVVIASQHKPRGDPVIHIYVEEV